MASLFPGADDSPEKTSRSLFFGGEQSEFSKLREREAELLDLQEEFGAPGIKDAALGGFRRVVDFFSRPNFAFAGFTDELLQGRGVGSAVARGFTELFSGIGSLQGQKEDFGQVLEQAGVGTRTLADFIPALERTWVGNFGSRGAAGLALDILTDPLTYLTFGASSVFRVGTKAGKLTLSRKGNVLLQKIKREEFEQLGVIGRTFGIRTGKKQADAVTKFNIAKDKVEDRMLKATAKDASLLDPGGIKIRLPFTGGKEVQLIDTPGIRRYVGPRIARVADALMDRKAVARKLKGEKDISLGFGETILFGAARMKEGISAIGSSMFNPFNQGRMLPKGMRSVARRLHRDFANGGTYLQGKMKRELKETTLHRLLDVDKDGSVWAKLRDVFDGEVSPTKLKGAERRAFVELSDLMKEVHQGAVEFGVLEPLQRIENYVARRWANTPEELQEVFAGWYGDLKALGGKHSKQRIYDSVREGVRISGKMNQITSGLRRQGIKVPIYPALVPEKDGLGILNQYIDWYSSSVTRKAWAEEAKRIFGHLADDFQIKAVFDVVARKIPLGAAERASLSQWFGKRRRLRRSDFEQTEIQAAIEGGQRVDESVLQKLEVQRGRLEDEILERQKVSQAVPQPGLSQFRIADEAKKIKNLKRQMAKVDKQIEAIREDAVKALGGTNEELIKKATKTGQLFAGEKANYEEFIDGLSDLGKTEFFRRLFLRIKSPDVFAQVNDIFRKYESSFPRALVDMTGIREPTMRHFGEEATYVVRSGRFWGDSPVWVPKIIAEDVETLNAKLLTSDLGIKFQRALKAYDFVNNWFKLGVYTIWPASATRDGYSNIALMALDIGLHALNPKLHFDTVGIMAGRKGTLRAAGASYDWQFLAEEAKRLNVRVEGRTFIEPTGEGKFLMHRSKPARAARRLVEFRALVENEARMALWIQNIRRGLTPRDAADKVGEFLFNYNETSAAFQKYIRRAIPFATFTAKNVELQWKALRRTPGLVINEVKAFRGRDDENSSMVRYEGEALKIRLDRDGKTVHMLNGVDLPLRNIDVIWKGTTSDTVRGLFSQLAPWFKVAIEAAGGKDLFTGRDLERLRSDSVGKVIDKVGTDGLKTWLGYKKDKGSLGETRYSFDGERFNLIFRTWVFSRFISTGDRAFKTFATGDQGWGEFLTNFGLDAITGLRAKRINLDEQQERRLRERVQQLEESLRRRGVLSGFTRTFERKDAEQAQFE